MFRIPTVFLDELYRIFVDFLRPFLCFFFLPGARIFICKVLLDGSADIFLLVNFFRRFRFLGGNFATKICCDLRVHLCYCASLSKEATFSAVEAIERWSIVCVMMNCL